MFPQIKSLLLPLYILLLTSTILHSQTYFTLLSDATGYADELQAHQLDSLNAAAQRLTEALPNAELQGDFGVYDMGFYRHHTTYEGGIPDVMQEAIDGLSTSYYLFFGREIGEEGELKKVWVEMGLPSTEDFCFWEDGTLSHLKSMVESRVNAAVGTSASDIFPIFTSTMNAMDYMENRLDQLVDCCGSTTARQTCDCGWSFGDIREYSILSGFHEVGATVEPQIPSIDSNCICFNIVTTETTKTNFNSGEVWKFLSIDEVKFSDSLTLSIDDIENLLFGMGEVAGEYGYSFFGAITDQFVFCESAQPYSSLRDDAFSLGEIENNFSTADFSIWFNILHFNGIATVSILSNGVDEDLIEMIFSKECLDREDWHVCAYTKAAVPSVPVYESNEGIVLKGLNQSSLTIKNDLIKRVIYLDSVDFGGNHVILDLSQVAIGTQKAINATGVAGFGGEGSILEIKTLFLGGDYSGYWYRYFGLQGSGVSNLAYEASVGLGYGWFVAVNDSIQTYTPPGFSGPYYGGGVHGSYKPFLGGLNLNLDFVETLDESWRALSVGLSGGLGPQAGLFAGGSVGTKVHVGTLFLMENEIPTNQRSKWQIYGNWIMAILF